MLTNQLLRAAVVGVVGVSAADLSAAIIPSWRVNTIHPVAIAEAPALANAISVSLLVTLTEGSLFNVAGLDLGFLQPGFSVYNHPAGGNGYPTMFPLPIFPALDFDTYVTTSVRSEAFIAGRLNGTGAAQFGPETFNVAWEAIPNTGPTGGVHLEIARITLIGAFPGSTVVPLSFGRVRDSVNPNADVAFPPIPLTTIPEPATGFVLGGVGVMAFRRRR